MTGSSLPRKHVNTVARIGATVLHKKRVRGHEYFI
jgi:hypothetical protein